jgi:hypothetical protein
MICSLKAFILVEINPNKFRRYDSNINIDRSIRRGLARYNKWDSQSLVLNHVFQDSGDCPRFAIIFTLVVMCITN